MPTPRGLAALRTAATLVHVVPPLRLRVRSGDEVRLVVGAGDVDPPPGAMALSACAFRGAVARAHRAAVLGGPARLLGLSDAAGDPAVDVGVPPCGATYPAGIHRVPAPDGWTFCAATTLGEADCRELGLDLLREQPAPRGVTALGLRSDPGTDVRVVYASIERDHLADLEEPVVELLTVLVARVTVEQLLQDAGVASSAGDER